MRLVAEKYRKLRPTLEYLSDEVVVAQAWKKTHAYMRRHNWYVDVLALDMSAVGLESNARNWSDSLLNGVVKPYEIEFIPAAKSEKWVVDPSRGWIPEISLRSGGDGRRAEKPPIRPLADIKIRDQVMATAAMLCLADIVESFQGDSSIDDPLEARRQGVCSYGNRLLCDWDDGDAWFRWGNGDSYRKYYADYRNFLMRPVAVGVAVSGEKSGGDGVYVYGADIRSFFDKIDREKLISRLKSLCESSGAETDPAFWDRFEGIVDWQWSKDSQIHAERVGVKLEAGLPQGLVASGFLANAYMITFDRQMVEALGKPIDGDGQILIHDYVRYVDDIRLVVSVDGFSDVADVSAAVSKWLSTMLTKYAGKQLAINEQKTSITSLSDIDNEGGMSARLQQVQSILSGPADRDSLDAVGSILEGFLTEQGDGLSIEIGEIKDKSLVRIAKFDSDIRTDSLKRFSAARLAYIMRSKHRLDGEGDSQKEEGGRAFDSECRLLAKKLIWSWMKDPSLATVLRKGLELYPSPEMAEPVFEAVYTRCSFSGDGSEGGVTSAMFDFLLADLFRCCIDFHGFYLKEDCPITSDPDGFLSMAARYAQRSIQEPSVPDFVARQAALLLAVLEKPAFIPEGRTGVHYDLLAIIGGGEVRFQHQLLALYDVASQITNSPASIAAQLVEKLVGSDASLAHKVLEELAKRGGDLWHHVWDRIRHSSLEPELIRSLSWAADGGGHRSDAPVLSLSKLIGNDSVAFQHEAALLRLAMGLIPLARGSHGKWSSPAQILVSLRRSNKLAANWAKAWRRGYSISCELGNSTDIVDPRYQVPKWVTDKTDAAAVYWIGAIIRSAAIGSADFTGSRSSSSRAGYRGLRTGWYKRRMGMMHSPETLVGEYATVSTWATDLIMTCLQWPGFETTHIRTKEILEFEGLDELEVLLKRRVKWLDASVLKSTNVPTVYTPVSRFDSEKKSQFRIVSIQHLLPRTKDFSASDLTLDSPRIKASNRNHLARVCRIAYQTIVAQASAENRDSSASAADLIVFPEVGVHVDDLDLVKRLADKTKAMVFVGLVFVEEGGRHVNVGRWIIPTYDASHARQWIIRDQGKQHMTKAERQLGIAPHRPCQHILEVDGFVEGPFRISGAICYDATDLKLASDLVGLTDLFVVSAHNKDVRTFDTLASALNYHMYQHVVVVNKGEFGGSTIQAPYKENYHRLISHTHGPGQISISVADLDLAAFRRTHSSYKEIKEPPAGIRK